MNKNPAHIYEKKYISISALLMFIFCSPATVSTSVVVVSGTVVIPVTTYKSSVMSRQVGLIYLFSWNALMQ